MIVHFVVDEKIIDQLIDNYLQVSDNNLFLVFGNDDRTKFKYITRDGYFIKRFNCSREDINDVLDIIKPQAIIVHSLCFEFAHAINKLNVKVKIAWIVWGYDIYMLPKIAPLLYGNKTREFLKKDYPILFLEWQLKKVDFLRKILYNVFKMRKDPVSIQLSAMRKIDFFCSYIKEDFEFFHKFYEFKNLNFVEVAFSTIDQYLAGNNNLRITESANNILVGNSNTIESNYLDVIDIISNYKYAMSEVYFILSYSKNEAYKEQVIEHGNLFLENHFCPLLNFMDRAKYIQLLQTCSVGIFYHYRQQAMGNIIAMLYMGARLYLSEKNPAYHYLIRKGIVVNSLDRDFERNMLTRLNAVEIENNRNKLDLIFGTENVLADLLELNKMLLD